MMPSNASGGWGGQQNASNPGGWGARRTNVEDEEKPYQPPSPNYAPPQAAPPPQSANIDGNAGMSQRQAPSGLWGAFGGQAPPGQGPTGPPAPGQPWGAF